MIGQRFWKHVSKGEGCWNWVGARWARYGCIRRGSDVKHPWWYVTYELKPCPKPPKSPRGAKPPELRQRTRMKKYNAKRKGRAFGADRVDEAFLKWIRDMPCAICVALNVVQFTLTEVEHYVPRSHGGYDKGDTYPTCAYHREIRHVTMGPKAFTQMLKRVGFDERKLCKKLVILYESERWPCP